jgi:hypothetical protein
MPELKSGKVRMSELTGGEARFVRHHLENVA